MSKKLLIASILLLCGWGAQAQDKVADSTYRGYKNSKAVVMTGWRDGIFTFLSENDRYLSGYITNEAGFVYDLTDGSTKSLDKVLYAYFSPDHYVAALPGENSIPYIYYNGEEIELEKTINHSSFIGDISYWNAQPNGNRVLMMNYEWDYGYNARGKRDSASNHVATVYDGKTGKVKKKLHSFWPRVDPLNAEANIGYGTRGYAISHDGMVVGGHGTWPTMDVISNNQTMFWDLVDLDTKDTAYVYAVTDTRFSMSDLVGANRDGSILVGYNEETGHGLIIRYNRAQKSFTVDTISPLPGYSLLFFNTVDDNERIFGYCGVAADPSSRKAVVYTKENGLIDLKTYLYEYYNIDIPELMCPTLTSPSGSLVSGFFFQNGFTMPWFIQFDTERILPRARTVVAKAASTGLIARVDWQMPLVCESELTGFEIYRDEIQTPIATVAPDVLTYTDDQSAMSPGEHTYYVVAVYGQRKAGRVASNKVLTIADGTTFPVQQIDHRLQYNRYASIYWGLPSSEVVTAAAAKATVKGGKGIIDLAPATVSKPRTIPAPTSNAKKYLNTSFDYIYNVNMLMYDGYCGIKIGDQYYVSSWRGNGLIIMDQYNNVSDNWTPAGLNSSVLSMVYLEDKQQLLCGSTDKVYIIDMKTKTVVNSFKCPSRHLSYLPDMVVNGTKGVLLAGGWSDAVFYTLDGKKLEESDFDFANLSVTGTVYYNGKLYAASQTGKYLNEIYTFDVATQKQEGEPVQVVEDPAVYNLLSLNGDVTSMNDLAYAAGLTICTLEDGTVALGAVYQCSYIHSQLMFLELESAPERRGYTLYRNGEILAENLSSRRYYDELSQAGSYKYEVKAFTTTAVSDFSPATTIKINAYDNCAPVVDLKAHETNRWVALNWDVASSETSGGIVGFSVFRNGKKLKELWNEEVALFYNDLDSLKLGTPYSYRIETLYANGCTASDSVKITLTDEGVALPPFGLSISYKKSATYTKDDKTYDVTVNWETPMFEEPLSIGYGTGQMISFASFSEEVPTEYWAAIGWDVNDLDLYQDLYLVGIEYLLGDDTKSFEAVVYLNDKQVHRESLKRATAELWQTMYFSKSFSMNQPKEVVVGYHITYTPDKAPVAIDHSTSRPGYSDLLSFDGKDWGTLSYFQINASWALRALVARKRDVEGATKNGVLNPELLEGKIMRLNDLNIPVSLKPIAAQTMAMPSPKAPLTLQGFNLYRQRTDIDNQEKIKLNADLMKTVSFKEAEPLPEGDYEYFAEAVYANTTKETKTSVTLDDVSTEEELNGMTLKLYPNPASEIVYVNGEYSHLDILDLGGRVLRSRPATSQIELGGLQPGTYFFRFTDEAGRKATYKVVVK